MAKINFDDAKGAIVCTAGKFRGSVDDGTALSGISSPQEGDYAWQQSDGTLQKYTSSSWGEAADDDAAWHHITGVNLNPAYDVIDTTDTGTAAGYKDDEVGRQEISVSLDSVLRDASNNKLTGAGMSLTWNAGSVPVKSVQYGVAYDEINMTDSATSSGYKEFDTSRAERTLQVEVIVRNDAADLALNSAQAATLTLASGVTISGTLRWNSKSLIIAGADASLVTYQGTFQGTVTETNVLNHAGSSKDICIVFENAKTYEGTYVGLNVTINGDIEGELTAQHTGRISGALTETYSGD